MNSKSDPYLKVGLMADGHGDAESLVKAIEFLIGHECLVLYHLGDICDSNHPTGALECALILQNSPVRALLGNNDHIFCRSYAQKRSQSQFLLDFYRQLPMVDTFANAVLAHSLPWAKELGKSCMTRQLGKYEISLFMDNKSYDLLFRGHSHAPEIIWKTKMKWYSKALKAGDTVVVGDKLPCIVTCGALFNGYCMTWIPKSNTISCYCMN